jgi:2-amino-4-hydroxy-6-hydroxymethyldihydropteridine diphosphokinase
MRYYFSLGSNEGDRLSNIQKAISFLKTIGRVVSTSSIYETAPLDMPEGSGDFLNLVLAVESDFPPRKVLTKIGVIEKKIGRKRIATGYAPRTIDIDILIAGDMVLDEKGLIIPHPRMNKRAFVLVPLLEIAPDMVHPVTKKSFREILKGFSGNQRVIKTNL